VVRNILLIALISLMLHPLSLAETVDGVLATVDVSPILRSDLQLAALVRLAGPDADPADLLDARIRLELQYRDLAVTGGLRRVRPDPEQALFTLIAAGGGREHLEARLPEYGLSWADLESLALRIAGTRAWVDQQLRPRVMVTSDDLEELYRTLVVAEAERSDTSPPPFAAVQAELHRVAVERGLTEEIDRWTEQARRRHEVTRFVAVPQLASAPPSASESSPTPAPR
jgi:hypothetical protein